VKLLTFNFKKNQHMRHLITALLLCSLTVEAVAQQTLDLSGTWSVTAGQERAVITLPNTLDGANIGQENQLQPMLRKPQLSRLTRKHSYIGVAIYQHEVFIPRTMAGKPLQLSLERVMWRSRLAIDGHDLGQMQESLVAPHIFNIDKGLSEGTHLLTLTIDNRQQHDISFDHLAHSYTNDTQIMWNGVLGEMKLYVAPMISEVQVYPDVEQQQILIRLVGADDAQFALDGISVSPLKREDGMFVLHINDMRTWSEFSPHLYNLSVTAG
jgi:hypothetical protein